MPYFGLIVMLIWIAALVDAIVADEDRVRHLPKVAWVLIVVLLPLVGSLVWFIVGRPEGPVGPVRSSVGGRPTRSAPSSPDDDEDFLRSIRERAEEQRRKGRELRDRQESDGSSDE